MGLRSLCIFTSLSAGIDFIRQNLTSIDARFWHPAVFRSIRSHSTVELHLPMTGWILASKVHPRAVRVNSLSRGTCNVSNQGRRVFDVQRVHKVGISGNQAVGGGGGGVGGGEWFG